MVNGHVASRHTIRLTARLVDLFLPDALECSFSALCCIFNLLEGSNDAHVVGGSWCLVGIVPIPQCGGVMHAKAFLAAAGLVLGLSAAPVAGLVMAQVAPPPDITVRVLTVEPPNPVPTH